MFYIAEIGGNHEGDFTHAEELVRLAIDSGADAVKFQLYTGNTLVSRVENPDRNEHFKKFELSQDQYFALAEMCCHAGRGFMASVWDADMLEWIDPYLSIHKVGSGDLTCYPMIRRLVATGKPIILSTGLSTLDEVRDTVSFVESLDASYISHRKLALLHCTSSYPTPDEDANLNAMASLRDAFGLVVGFSDHTLGPDAVEAAVAMGAEIIEKHFTDKREGKTFRDHQVSLTRDEVQALLTKLRRIEVLKGSSEKSLTPSERAAGHHVSFRRSVYAACSIAAGEIFTEENLTVLRPAHGISATRFGDVLGNVAKRDLKTHQVLKDSDVD